MKNFSLPLLLAFTLLSCQESKHKKEPLNDLQIGEVTPEPEVPENAVRYTVFQNHIYLQTLLLDSIPAKLILDTGCSTGLFLDSAFAKAKGLIPQEYYQGDQNTFSGRGNYIRGRNSLYRKKIPIRVNHLTDTVSQIGTIDLEGRIRHKKADGILGMAFIDNFIMEVNYQNEYIVFHDPSRFIKPANTKAIPFKYDQKNKTLFMDVEYQISNNHRFKEKTRIDLGYGPASIGFGAYTVRKLHLLDYVNEKQLVPFKLEKIRKEAETTSLDGRIQSIRMGPVTVDSPNVRLYTSKKGIESMGIILLGNYVFSRFKRVYFDFRGDVIYVEDQLYAKPEHI